MNRKAQPMIAGTPDKPKTLPAAVAAEWDKLVTELQAAGVLLTPAHRAPLETAATLAADIAECRDVVDCEGAYVTNEKTGALTAHPATRRLDALRRDLIKCLGMLGLRAAVAGDGSKGGPSLEDILS